MSLRITLVRHGRSTANGAGIWQGQQESPLSDEGQEQARLVAKRLAGRRFDLVVSSDLERARQTATALDRPFETDPEWREMDLGGWEGRPFDEVSRLHPDLLQAIRRGEAIAFGGTGETVADFERRTKAVFDRLAERVGEGSVLVFTHGGVIDAIAGRYLGRRPDKRSYPIVDNTSLNVFEDGGQQPDPRRLRLGVFNDAGHLGFDTGFLGRMAKEGVPIAGFVRHGVTKANKEGRIQGQNCWALDQEGRDQARRLADWYGPVDRVISSPLDRARQTAEAFGLGDLVEPDEAIQEMAFGDWEGLVFTDLDRSGDELAVRVYRGGEDLPRGGSGESFAQVIERMAGFLGRFRADPAQRTLVISHGTAVRALVASVLGRGPEVIETLCVPANTGVTHLAFSAHGPMLADYSVAPHLDH